MRGKSNLPGLFLPWRFCGNSSEESGVLITYDPSQNHCKSIVSTGTPQISVTELKAKLDSGDQPLILDVREPHEYRTANLNGYLIPLHLLPLRYSELDRTREVVVHCHHGIRSQHAVRFLLRAGFTNVKNLTGWIDQWSLNIDPGVRRY
jgi:adenylyltransferase/sulfurtransferase